MYAQITHLQYVGALFGLCLSLEEPLDMLVDNVLVGGRRGRWSWGTVASCLDFLDLAALLFVLALGLLCVVVDSSFLRLRDASVTRVSLANAVG